MKGYYEFPEEWGIVFFPRKKISISTKDLETLAVLREKYKDEYECLPIPWKTVLQKEKGIEIRGLLNRLWNAGVIGKFATTLHTQSGRPNYVSYYIWNDWEPVFINQDTPMFIDEKFVRRGI